MSRERISAIAHATLPVQNPLSGDALSRIIELCRLEPGEVAVDIGCGSGEFLARLVTRWKCRGLGVDVSPIAIERARERSREVEWRVIDGRAVDIEPESAALVASIGATHVFGSLIATLASIVPLVRHDGFVVLGEGFWREPPTDEWLTDLGAARDELCDRGAFLAAIEDCGLRVVEILDATPAEIDAYNDAWRNNLEHHLDEHAEDPDTSEIAAALAHARLWHPLCARYLGFMIVVARSADSIGGAGRGSRR